MKMWFLQCSGPDRFVKKEIFDLPKLDVLNQGFSLPNLRMRQNLQSFKKKIDNRDLTSAFTAILNCLEKKIFQDLFVFESKTSFHKIRNYLRHLGFFPFATRCCPHSKMAEFRLKMDHYTPTSMGHLIA
jgi:hypothetical protein